MTDRSQKQLGEMPPEFLEANIQPILQFCVTLLHASSLAGSGTLVQCGEKHGILTAHHVVHKGEYPFDFRYASDDFIGLLFEDKPHEFGLPLKYLVCHDIGIPVSDNEGPDLVFLEIPPSEKLGTLKAKKSFFNLTANSEKRLVFCEDDERGFWATSYSVEFRSSVEKMQDGLPALKVPTWVGYTGIEKRYVVGEFDYVEVGISYTPENDMPPSFGGASGGGLWKLPLSGVERDDGEIDLKAGNPVFAGVLFYQTNREENCRSIRCHGPKSIYQVVPSRLLG